MVKKERATVMVRIKPSTRAKIKKIIKKYKFETIDDVLVNAVEQYTGYLEFNNK